MELFLLLLPIVVLLSLGWTHFPTITVVFVAYLVAFGVRAAFRAPDRPVALVWRRAHAPRRHDR